MGASTVATESAFVTVYPRGLSLGASLRALEDAGFVHFPASFPYVAEETTAGGVVYLIDAARLSSLGDRATIESALELMATAQTATTVVIAEREGALAWLAGNANVGGWLVAPVDGAALLATVRAAGATLATRQRVEDLRSECDHLLRIGLALSAERDIPTLQQAIVRSARELTRADSGSLYLLEKSAEGEWALRFAVAQTGPQDKGTYLGGILPLSPTSISGYVALSGETVRIEDAYAIGDRAVYRFNPSFDHANGYRTKSVLAVPMRDHQEEIVGVIMLINRKPEFDVVLGSPAHTESTVLPFSAHDERVLLALASQAAVALENKALVDAIQDLFEHFVRASVKAIEVRDKSTEGHSARVADLTVLQAEAVNAIDTGTLSRLFFDVDALREIRYASLLHDFGKVAVPEYIFGKAKKLPDGNLDTIRLRFLLALEQTTDPREREALLELLERVEAANEPRVVADEVEATLDALANRTYRDLERAQPLLSPPEIDFLRIPRGSLSNDERRKMEQHVTQSFYFLREIPWRRTPWRNVAELAYGHHEHLDGTGYPRGLRGDEIAPQVRMMTISDVFDALTAKDRPYKSAMSIERALDILTKEFAERGKIDRELLDVFVAKKIWEPVMAARS